MMRGAKSRRRRPSSTGGRYRRQLLLEPLCDRRVLAAITGMVFEDVNDSARHDAEETGLQDRLVYIDTNDDGALGEAEPYRLTDGQGRFAFDNVGLGDYSVRLFSGTSSQRQTTPIDPHWGDTIELKGSRIAAVSHDGFRAFAIGDGALVEWDLESGGTSSLDLPASIASLHPLPDGRLVALGESDAGVAGDAAWLVSFADESVEPIDFGLVAGETGWSSMALDSTGNGVLLAAHADGEPTAIRQVRWADGTVHAIPLTDTVAAGTTVLSRSDAVTSLIATPSTDGLSLTQWSNATGTPVAESGFEIADGVGLLAFDEGAGLAIVEDVEGDLLVLDAAANMGLLHRLTGLAGPFTLDGHRERLYATDDSGDLVIQDLRDPSIRQTIALGEAAVGGMVLTEGGRAAIVGDADHLRRVRLDRPTGFQVSLVEGKVSADLFFGLYLNGDNAAPAYAADLNFELDEDTILDLAAPTLMNGAADPDEGDFFLLLRSSDPSFGTIQSSPAGRLYYRPAENFNGTDSFDVVLHDGRSISEPMTVQLDIQAIDDPIGPITFFPPIVPEDIQPGEVVGTITIVNPDVDEVVKIAVSNDDHFVIDGNQLILAEGGLLDFELQPWISLNLIVYDGEYDEPSSESILKSETIHLQVSDVPEAITGIFLDSLRSVPEGIYGDSIEEASRRVATVRVEDEDVGGSYEFSVSDERFEVLNGFLKIVDDAEIDFEEEPEIGLTITASDLDGPFEFTESFSITILDVNELPTTATFAEGSILERVAGVTVGDVSVDDPDQPSTVQFSVDDSRFEFDGATLKLRDGVFVERSQQEQIQLTLTVADYAEAEFVQSIDVTLDVLENPSPFHNEELNGDVNGDGVVEPVDALAIINYLNSHGPGPIEDAVNSGHAEYYYDVNNDGMVTPLDALLVINYLNRHSGGESSVVGGEGDPGQGESGLVPPATTPEGEAGNRGIAQAVPTEPSRVAGNRKPGASAFASIATPLRTTDLAVEAVANESDAAGDDDDTLRLISERSAGL